MALDDRHAHFNMAGMDDTTFQLGEDDREEVLPLNSRRLTITMLKQLAGALGLPRSASADELRQLISGQLEGMDKEPMQVQVVLQKTEAGVHITLRDLEGVFLEARQPAVEESDQVREEHGDEDDKEDAEAGKEIETMREEIETLQEEKRSLQLDVDSMKRETEKLRNKVKEMWKMNCAQLTQFDAILMEKEEEITSLKDKLAAGDRRLPQHFHTGEEEEEDTRVTTCGAYTPRRGRAPPVDPFTGENPEVRLEDWLPSLKRAAQWNSWSDEEQVMQLAGYLRGRASQEWNLLSAEELVDFGKAVNALQERLEPGSRVLAGQDFRHTVQEEAEKVTDYIRRLERAFQVAYGRDKMSQETRETILHGQMQEGLRLELLRSPSVSGALSYRELCVASKTEERRLSELKKRQDHFRRPSSSVMRRGDLPSTKAQSFGDHTGGKRPPQPMKPPMRETRVCYRCNKPGHLSKDCRATKTESSGRNSDGRLHQVTTEKRGVKPRSHKSHHQGKGDILDPISFLFSSSSDSEGEVCQVRVMYEGSQPRYADVLIQGVPAKGMIDTGADITIMGAELFKLVAAAAHLRKRDFKKVDKVPQTYDCKTFSLDGRIDLDVSFDGVTVNTPVYVKMDTHVELLLSEGVCRKLGIVSYHPDVISAERKKMSHTHSAKEAVVPTVRVRLLDSIRLPPSQSVYAQVQISQNDVNAEADSLLVEYDPQVEKDTGLQVGSALLQPSREGFSQLLISNRSGFTQTAEKGTVLGVAVPATAVPTKDTHPSIRACLVRAEEKASPTMPGRREKLLHLLGEPDLPEPHKTAFKEFLAEHHSAFSVEEGERGETDLIEMEIDTGNAPPIKQPVRRLPFGVREEVAKLIHDMQKSNVIEPSKSPWASPIILVRKRDGSHRFCVDYRKVNAVTKADRFPLPRIEDLLDRLGKCQYFSTLDLASGFWQIRVHAQAQEKTAFVTPQGLYQFRVMPFGLTNAPAVFQRLMEQIVRGLNPEHGPDFVVAYIDDLLVFSETLEDHLEHLRRVLSRLMEVGLKLKPSKCKLVCGEVEYLGHVITPSGLQPNSRLVSAVREFPTPQNIQDMRRFLGLASYYRKFIAGFARIAQPLHRLTRKGADFHWSEECQSAFNELKQKLVTAPVLAYPLFDRAFTLETDASIRGLGAVLSQVQDDEQLHPIAYASRALNPQEANYSVTELETLGVVWAMSHFHHYLYGNAVTVCTDHSAVKEILGAPNPSGKHARWWMKVYGSGVRDLTIRYRAGRDNKNADALSRSPQEPAPGLDLMEGEVQVASVANTQSGGSLQSAGADSPGIPPTEKDVTELLLLDPPVADAIHQCEFSAEQAKDPDLKEMIEFLNCGDLPDNPRRARKVAAQAPLFVLIEGVLYYLGPKCSTRKRVVVPHHLRRQVMADNHSGPYGGHFAVSRLFGSLSMQWWWQGMYADVLRFCKSCPECVIASGSGRRDRPPLHPIPVQRPFQIVGVDVMDLPKTKRGNIHVVVFQDFFTKWPMVYAVPDQKAHRIARLLAEEVIPFFGVPEALLSDRGTNLLSHLMTDLCQMMGITKLNTTAYHPECDGMVERFNRTLKSMLRKHAARFGDQWDEYLSGILWSYRNTPHASTGEKPSFLLFGTDCRSPTEAAFLPTSALDQPTAVADYREQLMISLSSARDLACKNIQQAQKKYKENFDRQATHRQYKVGEWVFIRFPKEESGKKRKLSRPWHGPYRITACREPDVTATKVYKPGDDAIQVHQSRVCPCPQGFPPGYYWYGRSQKGPGRPPKWVDQLLDKMEEPDECAKEFDKELVAASPDQHEEPDAAEEIDRPGEKLSDRGTERPRGTSRFNLRKHISLPKRYL